jgi:hypothetical protein
MPLKNPDNSLINKACMALVRGRSSVQSTPAAPQNSIKSGFFIKRRNLIRQLSAERNTNSPTEYGENPGTLFAFGSSRDRCDIVACWTLQGCNSPPTSLASAGDDLATTGTIWLDAICVTFDVTVHACAAYALGCRLHIIGVAGSWR